MKKLGFLILIVFSFFNCSKNNVDNNVSQSHKIVFGQIDSIYSNILDESRKVWIHIPESAKQNENIKYPTLYLLDGPGHFYSVTGMIKQLSTINGNTILPEMIVVAIPNTNRNRDLTPTKVYIDSFTGDSIQYESGGGTEFLNFLDDELIPYIEKEYPAASYRSFVGHSFGGLSVINALIKKPHLFNNYIAIDPSLWWDNMAFKNHADSILKSDNFKNKALFIAIANTMADGMDIQKVQSDTTVQTAHIRSNLQFAHSLEKNNQNDLDFEWNYYNEDSHGSVPLIAEYDGLRFLFHWHQFKGMKKIYHSASELTSEELLELPIGHFKQISDRFGYEVLPPEMLINSIGYYLLNDGMPEKAITFFNLNVTNFPNSSNVYDSGGDCYLALKDTVKALEFFNRAVELEDKDYYREKIKSLE